MRRLRTRIERIVIPTLAPELQGYRILHVSDIHFDNKVRQNRALWDALHSASADIVLITGDFITHDRYTEPLGEFVDGSNARDGVYGILGNHDYYYRTLWQHVRHSILGKAYVPNDWQGLVRLLQRLGIKILINEQVSIKSSRGPRVFIEGTDDPVLGSPEIRDPNQDYYEADLRILLSHSPDILYSSSVKKKKFDLLLSGHTHGGQIRIPGVGPLLTGTRYAKPSETYGMFSSLDGMAVNVSSGIGYSLMPIRINCPAEIILLELSQKKD
jgi:predicted MPP superfamily phosphohydrolase